jgi:hypothetical protein
VIYLRMGEDSLVHSPGADGCRSGPSLVAALHADTIVLANALGNGIGDDKAVYAYVPKLIEYYLGEKPLLADVTTYLCGIPEQRAEVLSRLAELVCKPVDGYGGDRIVIGPHASVEDLQAVRRQILARPAPLGGPGGGEPVDAPGLRRPPAGAPACGSAGLHLHRPAVGGRAGRPDPVAPAGSMIVQFVARRRFEGHLAPGVTITPGMTIVTAEIQDEIKSRTTPGESWVRLRLPKEVRTCVESPVN